MRSLRIQVGRLLAGQDLRVSTYKVDVRLEARHGSSGTSRHCSTSRSSTASSCWHDPSHLAIPLQQLQHCKRLCTQMCTLLFVCSHLGYEFHKNTEHIVSTKALVEPLLKFPLKSLVLVSIAPPFAKVCL